MHLGRRTRPSWPFYPRARRPSMAERHAVRLGEPAAPLLVAEALALELGENLAGICLVHGIAAGSRLKRRERAGGLRG